MAKRRQAWERLYDGIRIVRRGDAVYALPITETVLDAAESQLGSRLPHSYREFLKRFGPGELQGWVQLRTPLKPQRKGDSWTVVGRTTELRKYLPKHTNSHPNHQWLSSLIYFADNGGGDEYAWDPAAITRSRPHECRFYLLRRLEEDQPVVAGDSFWEFIEWLEADIRSWRDPEFLEEYGPGIFFAPAYLRAKRHPLTRDVKRWLAWNNGTVRDLLRSIQEGRVDGFPILADALEEAGCQNADLLDSCRRGDPNIDGAWALQVLLAESRPAGRQRKGSGER